MSSVAGPPAPFMRSFALPDEDAAGLRRRLWEEHANDVPVFEREGLRLLLVSIGPYTGGSDILRLEGALERLLS